MSATTTKPVDKPVAGRPIAGARSLSKAALLPIAEFREKKLRSHADAVNMLVESATRESNNFGSQTLDQFLAAVCAGLLKRVDKMKSAVMAHAEFRKLERSNTVVDEQVHDREGQGLRKRVMNVSLADIRLDQAEAGTLEDSHLYHSLVSSEFHRPGGQPNRQVHLVHDVGPDEVDVIDTFLTMADEAHFVLETQCNPAVVCPNDEKDQPPKDFSTLPRTAKAIRNEYRKLENAPLHALQQKGKATKLLLAVGQVNGRRPYAPRKNPALMDEAFRESNDTPLYLPNSMLAAKSIARSYTRSGIGSRISGILDGGMHTRPSIVEDGEVMVGDYIANELQEKAAHELGLYFPLPWKGKDYLVAFDTPAAFVPVPTGNEQADADASLASRLAYVLMAIELGHKLKKHLRIARGSTTNVQSMAQLIQAQLNLLVTPDTVGATPETLARKPLEKVTVNVTSPSPGRFIATAEIIPHTLMGEVQLTLNLKAELSAVKQ